ncbi:MAG: hypothetical protein J6M95_02145 [Bacilli bacterium]|nr:hypothetical protein [Bacilli bacterium]
MRRLWAHIIIAFAAIVAIFAASPSIIKGISLNSSNGDHQTRRQFTFQLTQREKEEDGEETKALTKDSAKEMAAIMEQRLINYGVSSYDITTSGDNEVGDIVTVSFTADSNEQYEQITTYLTFSGSFALMNTQDDVVTAEQFRNGSAYLKNVAVNEYPTVILPVKTDYTEWETLVKQAADNPQTTEADEESGTEASSYGVIYLVFNYQKGDTYQTLNESNKLNEKLLLTFQFENISEGEDFSSDLYYDSNKNSLAQVCGYQDKNGNGYADANEVKAAHNQASYLLNLFNASALDYDVKCIKGLASGTEVWLNPSVEAILSQEGKIVWNSTLTAVVAAIVIISLLLFVFYRLGALSVITTTLVSVFAGFLFMFLAGLEYGTLSVVGLAAVAIISLVSGIIYLNKLKEDAYRGHTLKKANTEASKKSLLPILDIHVIGVVVGLLTYLLGGTALHGFGSLLMFGSIVSAIVNTLGLKGMMWLSTNTTGLIGKYEVFGINPENVPNHMAEEKQKYYGPYADKDFTAKKKPVAIATLSVFVLSLVGVIVMTSLNGSNLLKKPTSSVAGNEIYVQNKIVVLDDDSKSELNETSLNEQILSYIEVEKKENGSSTYVELLTYVNSSSYVNFTTTESKTVESTTTNYLTTYYVVKLNSVLDLENTNSRIKGQTDVNPLSTTLTNFFEETNLFSSSVSNSISIKKIETTIKVASPEWGKVTLASAIAILVLTLYFVLRYRLSRGLATIIVPVASGALSLALIALASLLKLSGFTALVVASLPLVVIYSYSLLVLIMNKEREMIIDDKSRDTSYEHREELSKRALGIAYTPILAVSMIVLYIFINFFGFGTSVTSNIFLMAILASLGAFAIATFLYVPCANLLYKWFSKVNVNRKPKEHKNNKKAVVKKSAEPEEAIFIGIND